MYTFQSRRGAPLYAYNRSGRTREWDSRLTTSLVASATLGWYGNWNGMERGDIQTCVYVCVYIYIYIYIYVRTCIYVYMYMWGACSLRFTLGRVEENSKGRALNSLGEDVVGFFLGAPCQGPPHYRLI